MPECGGRPVRRSAGGKSTVCYRVPCGLVHRIPVDAIVIHALRDPRFPFLQQHATAPVLTTTLGAAFIGTILPFTSLAPSFRFGPLPAWYLVVVALILVCYLLLVTLVKNSYVRKTGSLI